MSSVLSHVFGLLIARLGLLLVSGDKRDAEILALRHQVLVLQRQIDRPKFTPADRTVIWNQRQLRQLLDDFVADYNEHRPHRSLGQRAPSDDSDAAVIDLGQPIPRTATCAGLINQYRAAA